MSTLKFTKTTYQKSYFCDKIRKSPNLFHQLFDKEKYFHRQFVWETTRNLTDTPKVVQGMIYGHNAAPKEELFGQITNDMIIQNLNNTNCFDFEYQPIEGDNLKIRPEYIYPSFKKHKRPFLWGFMYFSFENGSWKKDYHIDGFEFTTLGKGRLIVNDMEVF